MQAKRINGLDTLRALAILLVLMSHYCGFVSKHQTFGFAGDIGWAGVDLFFVLSGYLIGLQVLRPYGAGRQPDWARFFQRRAWRILPAYLAVLAVGFGIGVWASHWAIRETKIEDPSLVVWDEYVGMWIALLMLPAGWPWVLAAFVLFRIFDIAKPWPVSWADQKLHGGFGAMLDDAIAGLYALGLLQLAAWWLR